MRYKVASFILACVLAAGFLGGCLPDPFKPSPTDIAERKEWENKPHLMATAPDGTKLWEARLYTDREEGRGFYYHSVYFSSKGTEHTVPCGKTTRKEVVPAEAEI